MHLKRCNLTGCRVNPDKTTVLQDHNCTSRPVQRRAQVIPAYRNLQINLQHMFYIKSFKYKWQSSKGQRKFKTEFELQYNNHDDDIRWAPHPAHRCDANLPDLHGEDGPTRRSTQEEAVVQSRMHIPPRSQRERNLLRRVSTTTLSILILNKAYPTLGILSPLHRHAKLFGSGVLLLKGC